MNFLKDEWKKLLAIVGVFVLAYNLPIELPRVSNAVIGSLQLLKWYAQEHVLLCLVPSFLIAGAIANFISQGAVLEFLGPKAKKWMAYSVASVSGGILAVCSCTILPLFASIYKRGAGLGPATAFLYSGPAINIMAIILTANVLGSSLGLARGIGAIVFSVVIGLFMAFIFRKEEAQPIAPVEESTSKESVATSKVVFFIASMVGFLIFANWGSPRNTGNQVWGFIFENKWWISLIFTLLFVRSLFWFNKDEIKAWLVSSWEFTKLTMPLLFVGIIISGLLLGFNGAEGIIPARFVGGWVGGEGIVANFLASLVGALMYFATLTEIPIIQGLVQNGMGQGPALALLLAGPALSLPSMIVITSVMGPKKAFTFIGLVILFATLTGYVYGNFII